MAEWLWGATYDWTQLTETLCAIDFFQLRGLSISESVEFQSGFQVWWFFELCKLYLVDYCTPTLLWKIYEVVQWDQQILSLDLRVHAGPSYPVYHYRNWWSFENNKTTEKS